MKRLIFVLPAALMIMATIMTGTSGTAVAQDATFLKVAQDPSVGAFLTDAKGMTLYLFTKDVETDESYCYDKCATNWPPLLAADTMTLPAGVPGELATFDRTDGTKQVTYNGIPLYYWAHDAAPGDITGQTVGGVWFVVAPGAAHGPYAPAPGEGTPVPASTLQVGFTPELGPFLTDAKGMTLYLFTKDTVVGESACYDKCAENWPVLVAGDTMLLPVGVQGTLGAIVRTDGASQVTYNDIPLYYFASDAKAGDTAGQGVGEVWWIVPPAAPAEETEATPTS